MKSLVRKENLLCLIMPKILPTRKSRETLIKNNLATIKQYKAIIDTRNAIHDTDFKPKSLLVLNNFCTPSKSDEINVSQVVKIIPV